MAAVRKPAGEAAAYAELGVLFFFQSMAAGIWMVPLGSVLNAHGYGGLRPYAYATSAVAAFISPLIFGAMADRHAAPARVLRWLASASAAATGLVSWSIYRGWPAGVVLVLVQIYSLASAPTTSIASTIVFARLQNSQRQFGPLRALATFGWMCGCWLISAFRFDISPAAGCVGAAIWLLLAVFTYLLPEVPSPPAGETSFRQRMGWDALTLLKHRDHRVVFLTIALFSIPLAAFYPFTPPQLQQLGLQRTSAWMSLGQITEIVAMLSLASLFDKLRLKWIFAAGLSFGVLRFGLCAVNQRPWVLAGVMLHGFSYTLFFITAQIYLNERVEAAWRARAQALMWLMSAGVGSLIGYLGTGFWFQVCTLAGGTRWSQFWSGLSLTVALVLIFFLIAYQGQRPGVRRSASIPSSGGG